MSVMIFNLAPPITLTHSSGESKKLFNYTELPGLSLVICQLLVARIVVAYYKNLSLLFLEWFYYLFVSEVTV